MHIADRPRRGRHLLGPHVVGMRVVVRRVLPGLAGPTGGPAMTDVLGVCRAWGDGTCVVEPDDAPPVRIAIGDIVSGKPVPPRPSMRHRLDPAEAQTRAGRLFPELEIEDLGGWTLRHAAGTPARRANSVLAMQELAAGTDPDHAVRTVEAFYRARGRRPVAAVLPGSPQERLLTERGWVPESDDGDTHFELGGVARALRSLAAPAVDVELAEDGSQAVATIGAAARGVAVVHDDWVGLRGVDVAPEERRRGLGSAVLGELLDWAAARGATTAYLQVLADNRPALQLYGRLGLTTHHTYRYLAPGVPKAAGTS